MKKDTFVLILFCGVLACGWVFGQTISGGDVRGAIAGLVLSFFSMFIGMVLWGIFSYELGARKEADFRKRMASRERELIERISRAVESQRRIDIGKTMVFSEALARKCLARVSLTLVPPEDSVHLMEQAEAILEEEVSAAKKRSGM